MNRPLGIRWTVGDVSPWGFEALRLSLWGAWRLFGPDARYAVIVNTLTPDDARRRTGTVPAAVNWLPAGKPPAVLRDRLDGGMAEGVAWKLAPARCFPDRYELSLDHDCVLWDRPAALDVWLREETPRCLITADVELAHGAFTLLTRRDPATPVFGAFPLASI